MSQSKNGKILNLEEECGIASCKHKRGMVCQLELIERVCQETKRTNTEIEATYFSNNNHDFLQFYCYCSLDHKIVL